VELGALMQSKRVWLNFAAAVICYSVCIYRWELEESLSGLLALMFFWILQLQHAIRLLAENFWLLPCSYKAEILIEPTFRALVAHDFAKDYYDKALPQVEGVESKSTLGGESLWKQMSVRLLVMNGLFWSDLHKTFVEEVRFRRRILDFNISESEQECYLSIEIKRGCLRFRWEDWKMFSGRKPILISEFPLLIFEHFPVKLLKLSSSESWNDFSRVRRKRLFSSSKNRSEAVKQILEKHGFSAYSEGELDNFVDRDGEAQLMDPNDGFWCFRNEYFVVKFKELDDEI
jgi:hypothetical protein